MSEEQNPFDRRSIRLRLHPAEHRNRFIYPVLLILFTIFGGTLGYALIEGWPFVDSLYMTILTVTTIGYGEPYPLSPTGRVFTIGLMVTTIGVAGYAVSTLATFIFEGELNRILRGRQMDRRIENTSDHIIICGCGRMGLHIAEEFHKTETPFVVVEQSPSRMQKAQSIGDIMYLIGNATNDEVLYNAGIERAAGLIATLHEDKDNLFVVVSARSINPEMRIVSRVADDDNANKLLRAGADEVVSPNAIGGLRMASVMIRPKVVSFLDEMLRVSGETLRISEISISETPTLIGQTLAEAAIPNKTGMLVVAIMGQDNDYRFNPSASTELRDGDTLIVMGTPTQLRKLSELTL